VEGGISILKRIYQKYKAGGATSLSRAIFLRNIFPNNTGSYSPFQILFGRPATFSLLIPSNDNIPSSSFQQTQRQLLKDLRDQKLSYRNNPTRQSLPIGVAVYMYDKEKKYYLKRGIVMEKLRNSSYYIETEDGKIYTKHITHLKVDTTVDQ